MTNHISMKERGGKGVNHVSVVIKIIDMQDF